MLVKRLIAESAAVNSPNPPLQGCYARASATDSWWRIGQAQTTNSAGCSFTDIHYSEGPSCHFFFSSTTTPFAA